MSDFTRNGRRTYWAAIVSVSGLTAWAIKILSQACEHRSKSCVPSIPTRSEFGAYRTVHVRMASTTAVLLAAS